MNEDEWGYVPGSWAMFENAHGWCVTVDVVRLPARWTLKQRKEYAAALLWALNHGQPSEGDHIDVALADSP